VLVPFDFALNRPRRLSPEEKSFLVRYGDDSAAA
jgi:acyl-CoA thioester hydrolase